MRDERSLSCQIDRSNNSQFARHPQNRQNNVKDSSNKKVNKTMSSDQDICKCIFLDCREYNSEVFSSFTMWTFHSIDGLPLNRHIYKFDGKHLKWGWSATTPTSFICITHQRVHWDWASSNGSMMFQRSTDNWDIILERLHFALPTINNKALFWEHILG